ncbi:phosphoserine transaminase [Jannaschia sp. Os4]|uniref:phosphoserine transaminase n=1 Tax=Jannaschia sp. Os4 TaxID=2807617 RepID=UPI001939DF90|nr:phosphoserine transaminase [Jannaschia sp. Os4]MBM2575876.1 phosphoserine transaminase [Jannaschia sp. Os4]
MTGPAKPDTRPADPRFSSGPCKKHPGFSLSDLATNSLGRSHRAQPAKSRLKEAIDRTHALLGLPADYRVGIVPASDTGAYEMAMWTMMGARPVTMLAWESFGKGWVTDAVKQLDLDATVMEADYGHLPDLSVVDWSHDVGFTWNGTTSGVAVPDGEWIPADREGLTFVDATSACFAMDLPWDKCDVTTFSWQKVLGGEGAHGVLILSPRAVERLESYAPDRPLPKVFRLTKGGKLIEGIFEGATINTPSMMCVEDYLSALDWAEGVGLDGLIDRSRRSARAIWEFCETRDWIANLAVDPATRSTTSICLTIRGEGVAAKIAKRLEAEGVALDVKGYRDAPEGLRIWCGATVEPDDVAALMPWIEWAYAQETQAAAA